MRSLWVVLAIVLAGASPAPAVPGGDRVPELVGTWTCRNPAGVLSTVAYRGLENGVIVADEKAPGAADVHDRFRPSPGGGWLVNRDVGYASFSGYAPAWTTGPWVITDYQKHGLVIRYERVGDGTLWRTFSISGRPPQQGDVCAKGDVPPEPALCAVHDVPPSVVRAAQPEPPPAVAMENGIQGRVDVLVSLDAGGRVIDAVVKKSPSGVLDGPSITAARRTTFRPALHDCKPVPSEYMFAVEFIMR